MERRGMIRILYNARVEQETAGQDRAEQHVNLDGKYIGK